MKLPSHHWISLLAVSIVFGGASALRAQTFQVVYSFEVFGTNGDSPHGGLIQASDGNFYGTTFYGGIWDFGTVFRMTPDGIVTVITSFDGSPQHPNTTLVEAGGALYGFTYAQGGGFTVTTNGDFTVGTNELAGYLAADWIQARDGNLYATDTSGGTNGGAYGDGGIVRMTLAGQITTIASFNRTNAATQYARYPYGRLLQASDGSFYGVAEGGYYGAGCIFRLTTNGVLTTVASFDGLNGKSPNGGLIEANDGNFYGTCEEGGSNGENFEWMGTVFRMTPSGVITMLFAFTGGPGQGIGLFPGANPRAGLVQASDSNLYGTTAFRGTRGAGNIFRIVMPGPQLSISRAADQLALSWRTNYTGFTLQFSSTLSSSNWTDCTNSAAISGGKFWVTNPISSGAQFFRLRK
ncbi:MAG TPA: choice-of-anchor tandem repeat GloVer-containing protein [Verrucomicrobiae bacterium]|nr:choice-of-anchor tandem repeat GloVer-containing protein [Verrucomicrobiae bacterium]